MKKLTTTNLKKFQIENPVRITKEQMIKSHIAKGFSPEKAAQAAKYEYMEIIKYVSDKYQAEVDYYLKNLVPSDSEPGKEIDLYINKNRNFFNALIFVAMGDLV
jgi:hypothetical protein